MQQYCAKKSHVWAGKFKMLRRMASKSSYKDRTDAGKCLGDFLKQRSIPDAVILGLPRGGVVLSHEVAAALDAPMDVVIVRKIGHPHHQEFGIGALSEDEVPVFNPESVKSASSEAVREVVSAEREELRRRLELYRPGRAMLPIKGKNVIVVDDGIATGVTAAAAGKFLRTLSPSKLILAIPVGPVDIDSMVTEKYDEVLCLRHVKHFSAVGLHYDAFPQTSDREVLKILEKYHPKPK